MKNPHDGDFKDLAEDHPERNSKELLPQLSGWIKVQSTALQN